MLFDVCSVLVLVVGGWWLRPFIAASSTQQLFIRRGEACFVALAAYVDEATLL